MNHKAKYNTRQYEEILEYLKSIKGEHVTAKEVYAHLLKEPTGPNPEKAAERAQSDPTVPASKEPVGETEAKPKIGMVTVYRQLERLVDEGLVYKYVIDQNTPACFEYIGTEDCEGEVCVHGKCLKCGKLFHLHCDEMLDMKEHLIEHHGFTPDFHHTVIYGICEDCRQ